MRRQGFARYTVTVEDAQGHTGEFKPFDVQASQITIVEKSRRGIDRA